MRQREVQRPTPNSIVRVAVTALGLILQVIWIVRIAMRLTEYYAVIQLCTSVLTLLVTIRVFSRHINSGYKILWIVLILLVPVLGLCLYAINDSTKIIGVTRKRFAQADAQLKEKNKFDPQACRRLYEENRNLANQVDYLQRDAGFPAFTNTDVVYYSDTTEALHAQMEAMKKAEHFIFLEYHAIENSTAWQGMEEILAERAAHGVEVRVFYDDMGSMGFVDSAFLRHLRSLQIKCRVFNPLMPVLNFLMNNRDHRKITVIDGLVGFTGGYNLADEYFNITHPYGQWKDSGIRLEGDGVRSLTLIFLEMWMATDRKVEDVDVFLPDIGYRSAEHGVVVPFADSPLDDKPTGENVYMNMIHKARKYIYIATPYLIISDEMVRALTLAADSGVDVRIVTPGIPDKKIIFAVTKSYYGLLIAHGVKIYAYTPGFLHEKQFVADDEIAVVGTINMDFRSLNLHFEDACLFCNCSAVAAVKKDFDTLFPQCEELTPKYSSKGSRTLRLGQCVLRLFAPLL